MDKAPMGEGRWWKYKWQCLRNTQLEYEKYRVGAEGNCGPPEAAWPWTKPWWEEAGDGGHCPWRIIWEDHMGGSYGRMENWMGELGGKIKWEEVGAHDGSHVHWWPRTTINTLCRLAQVVLAHKSTRRTKRIFEDQEVSQVFLTTKILKSSGQATSLCIRDQHWDAMELMLSQLQLILIGSLLQMTFKNTPHHYAFVIDLYHVFVWVRGRIDCFRFPLQRAKASKSNTPHI